MGLYSHPLQFFPPAQSSAKKTRGFLAGGVKPFFFFLCMDFPCASSLSGMGLLVSGEWDRRSSRPSCRDVWARWRFFFKCWGMNGGFFLGGQEEREKKKGIQIWNGFPKRNFFRLCSGGSGTAEWKLQRAWAWACECASVRACRFSFGGSGQSRAMQRRHIAAAFLGKSDAFSLIPAVNTRRLALPFFPSRVLSDQHSPSIPSPSLPLPLSLTPPPPPPIIFSLILVWELASRLPFH